MLRDLERDTLDNVRHAGTIGRPKGKPNLSENVKVGIIAAKRLQLVSQGMIANEYDVARRTVNILDESHLTEQGKAKLQSFTDQLSDARELTIQRIKEKLEKDEFKGGVLPNLLNAVNANYRLETNQPTSITNESAADNVAIAFSNLLKRKRAEGSPLPSDAELIALMEAACVKNQADLETVKARVFASIESPE